MDLLRRLLDAIPPVIRLVPDVDDSLRDQLAPGLAAGDELGEPVRRPAGGGDERRSSRASSTNPCVASA
ncbi:MAG: hypothetical protein ACRDNM_05040, partial [Gaiellaceae bacterium]